MNTKEKRAPRRHQASPKCSCNFATYLRGTMAIIAFIALLITFVAMDMNRVSMLAGTGLSLNLAAVLYALGQIQIREDSKRESL